MSNNSIQKFIDRGLNITSNKRLKSQTWSDFFQGIEGKKIYLWGIGVLTEILFSKDIDVDISGAVDKSVSKQGTPLSLYVDVPDNNNFLIDSERTLLNYDSDDIVVVISSAEHADDIASELDDFGIHNYYSILHMEANSTALENKINNSYCDDEIVPNKIVVWAHGGSYGGHERYICEALLNIRKDIDIVWCTTEMSINVPENIRLVFSGNKKKYSRELRTAKIWISGTMIPREIKKKPEQIFIEVKHWASITLKKFYLDAPSVSKIQYNKEHWEEKGAEMDYIFVGSKFDAESCRRGLSSTAQMIHIGSCRSDALFLSENLKNKICSEYNISKNVKILLYAPTYRFKKNGSNESRTTGTIDIDFDRLHKTLEEKTNCEWIILLRLHPAVKNDGEKFAESDYVINVSEYPDSEELCSVCDIMISDYSSIMFEPAFVGKPVFLYAPDKDSYIDNEYELLLDYDTLPFPVAMTNTELNNNILSFDEGKYRVDVDAFMRKYGVHEDGHASERAAQFISGLIDEKGIKL